MQSFFRIFYGIFMIFFGVFCRKTAFLNVCLCRGAKKHGVSARSAVFCMCCTVMNQIFPSAFRSFSGVIGQLLSHTPQAS